MDRRTTRSAPLALLCVLCLANLASAEITGITGSVRTIIQEFRLGSPVDSSDVSDEFPTTSTELPLQVLGLLISEDPDPAAAAAAAQFADPRDLPQANPEEFAINLTLNSVSPNVFYEATARAEETRNVVFSASELGRADGATVRLIGRVFLDGVLAVYAVQSGRDLSGAEVLLRVTIVREGEGLTTDTVFSGTVALRGAADGAVNREATGDFPTNSLLSQNLAFLVPDFATLRVLIIPNLQLEYEYSAIVGRPLTLRATVQVEAANIPDEVGVAALLGTPADTLTQVIALTQSDSTAVKFRSAMESARDNPSGDPAFPESLPPLFGLCGVMGFESVVALLIMSGLRAGYRRNRAIL